MCNLYNEQGYEAEINSYISSDEYQLSFGDNIAPRLEAIAPKSGIKNVAFNRTFALARGFAANDAGKSAKLIKDWAGNFGYQDCYSRR